MDKKLENILEDENKKNSELVEESASVVGEVKVSNEILDFSSRKRRVKKDSNNDN